MKGIKTNKIKAPSGLMISIGSPAYKRLRKKGYVHSKDVLIATKNVQKRKIKDPSGRMILINGKRYKKLIKLGCKLNAEKTALVFPNVKEKRQAKKCVLNPDTRRLIYVNGPTFKRLRSKYRYDEERNIFIIPEEQPLFDGEYWEINQTNLNETAKKLVTEERTIYGEQKESKYLKMYFYNYIVSLKSIYECLNRVYQNENNAIKLNIAFGYVTQKEGNVKLIKPGRNYFFNEPHVMKNKGNFKQLENEITEESIVDCLSKQFPDSQTQLLGVYAMAVKITRLDFPIGGRITLPNYITDSRLINGLEEVNDNMCFWACMALARGCRRDRYTKMAHELFTLFYTGRKTRTPLGYPGFDYINELDDYEQRDIYYAINIVSFYDDGTISYIRKSQFNESRTPVYLNLYLNHFSYITNFQKLAKVYLCKRCDMKFRNNYDMEVHFDTCTLEQKDVFNKFPKLWEKSRNIIIELTDYYDVDVDFKYDYLITFDLESINQKIIEKAGEKLTYVGKHVPVSASIATNVPGFEEEKFILSENPKELTKLVFEHFDKIATKAKEMMLQKMQMLTCRLDERCLAQVESYCSVIPIVGFNSSFYDINLLSNEGFINEIIKRDKTPFVIKEGNKYKVIKTQNFMFLDQMYYCAAGTSLSSFIKAYDVGENKGWFPYEWFDSYTKLDYPVKSLEITDFYSSLKDEAMSEEDFNQLMKICVENDLILVKDLLKWYNNLDVRPMLKACLKQKEFFL